MTSLLTNSQTGGDAGGRQKRTSLTQLTKRNAADIVYDDFKVSADVYGDKGVRKQMEDEHFICASTTALQPKLPQILDMAIFGIFDGHGGKRCAGFVRDNIANEMCNQLLAYSETNPEIKLPLPDNTVRKLTKTAYQKLDSRIATELSSCKDGCTAIVVLIHKHVVYICSLGDSAAYLCQSSDKGAVAIPLSETHKPWVIKEKERITRVGGTVINGRIEGQLEVSRSFGDISLKRYGILCTPTFMKFNLHPEKHPFILLGCDGFWSSWTAAEAVENAVALNEKESRRALIESTAFDPKTVCKKLVETVIVEKKSQDNVSCLMIKIDALESQQKDKKLRSM